MKSWSKLAKIVKVTKNLDFVVQFTTESFFVSKHIKDLCGHKLCIVPPPLDVCRFITVENISKQGDKVIISSKEFLDIGSENSSNLLKSDVTSQDFIGKCLLISDNDIQDVFADLSDLDIAETNIVGMQVVDKNRGYIGTIKDIQGNNLQKYLVIDSQNNTEVLIPYVKEIVEICDSEVRLDCPDGLIDLNTDDAELSDS